MSTATESADGSTTVKGHFNRLTDQYTQDIVNGTQESTSRSLGQLVRHLIVEFEQLWRQLGSVGAMSANEELDDYSTTAVEMLWTPYILADLYQAAQTGATTATATVASASADRDAHDDGRMIDHGRNGPDNSSGNNVGAPVVLSSACTAQEDAIAALTRQECLARSHEWFRVFFDWMENTGLADEKTIATYGTFRPDQRTARIELARKRNELEQKWREAEGKVRYLAVKRRRMRELMAESGESLEEAGGEEEEALRARATARLEWSIYDACHQMQLSSRELEMLQQISPEKRAEISAGYQRTIDAVRRGEVSLGKETYTILPGGMMLQGTLDNPRPVDAEAVRRGGGLTTDEINAMMANQQVFRQQVRAELQVDRNPCTMTLEAFAMKEMAEIQRQMDEGQHMQEEQQLQDERIGPDGVEERQRQKDAAWDDWKQENPANGQTDKGNYS